MSETAIPKGVRLPKPVETHVNEAKGHRVSEFAYKKPKEAHDEQGR